MLDESNDGDFSFEVLQFHLSRLARRPPQLPRGRTLRTDAENSTENSTTPADANFTPARWLHRHLYLAAPPPTASSH